MLYICKIAAKDILITHFGSQFYCLDKLYSVCTLIIKISSNLPVAIKFYAEHLNEPEYLLWFTQKLERLASYLYATSQDVNKRIERYSSVLTEIEQKPLNNIDDPLTTIDLEENEKNSFRKALNSDIYELTPRKRNYIILRLNDFVSDEATENQYSIMCISQLILHSYFNDPHYSIQNKLMIF